MSAAIVVASGLAAAAAGVLLLPRGVAVAHRLRSLSPGPAGHVSGQRAEPGGTTVRGRPAPPRPSVAREGRSVAGRAGTGATAGPSGGPAGEPSDAVVAPRLRLTAGLGAGAAVAVLAGGAVGVLAGVLTATAVGVGVGRLRPAGAGDEERQALADLPLALDLLAACSASGVPLPAAIDAVARAVGGPLGTSWSRCCAALRLGGDPVALWGREPLPPLRRPGRVLAAALTAGSASAGDLERLAAEEREAARRRGEAAARRAGVAAVLPLGLCFLPAFVLVGVVPVVVGLAGGLLR